MKTKLFLLGLVGFIVLLCYTPSRADFIPSPDDTLKVGGGYYGDSIITADAGDSRVQVIVYMRNTFDVPGFVARLVYDTTVMTPYPPVPESSYFQPPRCNNLVMFEASYNEPGIIRVLGSAIADPYVENIPEGRGPIVEFYFDIKPTAQDGCYPIRLEDDTLGNPDNYITDVQGTADYLPVLVNGTICIGDVTPPENNPPVIAQVATQTVLVGQTLSFQVSATDQDGDLITLSAQSLPENATFPQVQGTGSVNGTFTFIPTAQQAPDTILVTFIAVDEEFAQDNMTVIIYLYKEEEPPGAADKIEVLSTSGGVPGSSGRLVPINFSNQEDTVYGIEFSLDYDYQAIIIDSLVPAERINGFTVYSNLGDSLGKLTVLIFGLGNEMILPGSDDILYLAVSVDSLAPFGYSPLTFTSGWEAISIHTDDTTRELVTIDGIFAVDRFGDVNLDRRVDVGDAVSLVAYILGNITLDARNWEAADINRDADVNVGDLVGVINTILGRPLNAPLERYTEPMASLHLEYDLLQAGSSGQIEVWADLKTSVAGVQLTINYDPEQLSILTPELTERSSSFNKIYYKDNGNGNLTMVFFRFGGSPIVAGQGSILSLPVVTGLDFDKDNSKLVLEEAILADPEAVVIPVDKGEVILPKFFNLSQNYPNPFNPNTIIEYMLTTECNVEISIYNILGQRVRTLVDEYQASGHRKAIWDGKDNKGCEVASGIYFYRIKAGESTESKKMVLIK